MSIEKGACPFMSACGWCFFLFFPPLEGSTAALKRREEGRQRERGGGGVMGQGRDREKVELTENNNKPTAVVQRSAGSLLAGFPVSRLFECVALTGCYSPL